MATTAFTGGEGSAHQQQHHVTRMQQIVLQWDYYKLTSRAQGGKGEKNLRQLRKVPERFTDIQVRGRIRMSRRQ